jgi:tetratricopeptide (TPR) repeat protein
MRRTGISAAVALALLAVLLAAYWPALHGGFIWDDDAHVTREELRPLHGLVSIWSQPGATQQYYPVLHSAFWVEHRLWGDSPLGYHLLNVLLHAASTILLYQVLRRLAVPGAMLGAAAFALHPVCVETVAWISEQKNTLSTVFYLASALAYLRFDDGRRRRDYALGFAFFALALLSKSVTATLPAALLVILWWRRGRLSWRNDVLPLVPWFCMSLLAGAMTAWMERNFIGARGAAFGLGIAGRFLVAGRVVWFYLGKLLWPTNLVFNYPRWSVDPGAPWQYAFPAAAAAVLAALWACRGRSRGPLAAALLFAGTLFPALGFINVYPFVFSYVADHFQYLAAAGMISAVAAGLAIAARRLPPGGQAAARGAAVGVVALLGFLTWRQSAKYGDVETFYRAILDGNPASWLAHDNLGVVLVREGKTDEAAAHYREAIRLNPSYPEAYNNLGNVLARSGDWADAADAYAGALRARPWFAAAEYNWGNAMNAAGLYREAMIHFTNALRLQPVYPDARYGLANALANSGRLAEAVPEYREALRLRPDSPEAHANLGLALAEQGNFAEALAQIAEAVRLRPGYAEAHAYFGYALAGSGRLDEAIAEYRESLRVGPDNPDVHYQIGIALQKLGRGDEANAEFSEARRLSPAR